MNHKAILQNQQMSAQAQARTLEQQLAEKDQRIAELEHRIAVLEGRDDALADALQDEALTDLASNAGQGPLDG
jgi:TolA-binding protein